MHTAIRAHKVLLTWTVIALAGVLVAVGGRAALAANETIVGGADVTTEVKTATAISDIVINGADNSTVPVKLLVTNGTLAMTTTTGLTFTGPSTGATLYFSGSRSDVNAALATLKYTRMTIGTDTLEVSLVSSGEVFYPGSNHLYEYVSSALDWNAAQTAAASRTKYGATGYLATITSQGENDFVSARLTNAGWMGASDSVSEGVWKWIAGPETGTQFWQGASAGSAFGGNYANWNTSEPNDSSGNEDCGQFLAGGSGKWNDLPCSGSTLPGYVVEYGAPGNLPTVASKNVNVTTSDSVAPTTPGTPSTTTPTSSVRPVWTWAASTDAGVGLASPAYSVQWSQSSTFASGVTSGTAASASFTHPADLASGTWYFRVRASDTSSNTSSYSATASVVVDAVAPTVPGLSTTTVNTRLTSPSISWTLSTDAGSGLAALPYTIQWSTSSSFGSYSSGTSSSTPFAPPTLAQGTWYFRVSAKDVLNNTSAYSATLPVVIDTTSPTTPGSPSTASPTNNQKPVWTWAASTDSGSGLDNPAYSVQWSQSSTFASGITSASVNTAAFTQPTNLTDGVWYFRVRATDLAGNDSSFSATSSVTVDATPPAVSAMLATTISDTSEVLTWTTDKLATSQVLYGPTTTYYTTSSQTDISPRVTSHSRVLSGLIACTLYHYQLVAVDTLGNTTSSTDASFITSGCAGAAAVTGHSEMAVTFASGGSLSLANGSSNLALTIPANFSANDASFQIKQIDPIASLGIIGKPSAMMSAGSVYDLKAMRDTVTPITTFAHPITLAMSYTSAEIAGLTESSLVIYRWDSGTGWQKLDNCAVNTATKTVTCTTNGFSTFALFGAATVVAPVTAVAPVTKPAATPSKRTYLLAAATTDDTGSAAVPNAAPSTTPTTGNPETSQTNNFQATTVPLGEDVTSRPVTVKTASPMRWWIIIGIVILGYFFWLIAGRRRHDDDNGEKKAKKHYSKKSAH